MGSSNIDKLLAKKRFGRRKVGKSSQQKKSEDEKFDGPKSSSKVTIKTGATSTSTEARTKKRAKKTNIYKKKVFENEMENEAVKQRSNRF